MKKSDIYEHDLTEAYRSLKIDLKKQINVIDDYVAMDFDYLKKTINKMKKIQKKLKRLKYKSILETQ